MEGSDDASGAGVENPKKSPKKDISKLAQGRDVSVSASCGGER
jgi:hypothetical protein